MNLSAENKRQLWIPEGFAHGFGAERDCGILYKTTNYYHPDSDRGIVWNDPILSIKWPTIEHNNYILSIKDARAKELHNMKELFL